MILRVTKGKEGKDTLTCIRDDGSTTISKFRALHDLVHYAVETTLGLKESFYSLVASGWDIESFNTPGAAQKLKIPVEASQTEFIVGLFETEIATRIVYDDFVDVLRFTLEKSDVPFQDGITHESVDEIRTQIGELLGRWAELEAGESLELSFPTTR